MHTGIPRKSSSFKPALNKSSASSTASRLPTPSYNKKCASTSCSLKENILPVAFNSKKQGSTGSLTFPNSSNSADERKIKKEGDNDLEDVQSVRSKQKDGEEEFSFTYPVLADLSSSMIVEADENSRIDFDYHVIDYDREYDINLKLELSLYETRLAARHNDSIQVALKRTRARFLSRLGDRAVDDDEASISLDYIPESDAEGILGVEYIIDDEEEDVDDTFDLSGFLNKNVPPAVPLPPLPTVPALAPVMTEEADDTFDLSEFLERKAPVLGEDRLLDTSLSELMKVEIDYDREFPNTAIGRPPHIFVCRYKRDMKRKAAAQKALEKKEKRTASAQKEKNRCVLENRCIIDVPLQIWTPSFSATVLSPKRHNLEAAAAPPSIPSLVVTSPSDDDVVRVPDKEPPEFDEQMIECGAHKYFFLDASYHNWCLRFGVPIPNELDKDEDEEEEVQDMVTCIGEAFGGV